MQNNELKFIEIIKNTLSDNSYLGDDCAYLKDLNLCVSADSLIEDIHFSLVTTTPFLLARKALKVNISDILASGAKPKYATVCLSGKLNKNFISEFYFSINSAAEQYGVKIIGGDLTGGDKLAVSICVMGDTKGRNISSRKNAKEGYILALCGQFGTSAEGLKYLTENPASSNYFTNVHLDPVLHPECSENIAKNAVEPYAMTDSSDGLINALEWISKSSGAGIKIDYSKIPKHPDVSRHNVLFGGEDYSLVAALSREDFLRVNDKNLIEVGTVTGGQSVLIDGKDAALLERGEFLHFD